ncbi:hypothetical protein [Flavobacterium sp. 7A]|uniref:hypothetical protein n=1 Tax=Flavobacterium sp. 7A TaxID=2940571 RepID=UPI0022264752|nr:hypothetical protein [Flavobacterium sp. 7A]MCW2120324.1 hypothetical protein [Flavobacterium sp. 7A]
MKTNFKIVIAVCIAIFGLHSCSDIYDTINLNEANSRVIATSQMNFANTIRIGTSITLGDLSSGVESRLWTLPTGVADIVDSDNDVTSTAANVKAIFNVVGVHDVRLQQVFSDNAFTVLENTAKGKELDTIFQVTVLPQIKTVLKVNVLNSNGTVGAPLNLSNGAKNQVTAGSVVRYVVESAEGAPASFTWTTGATVVTLSNDKRTLDVRYNKVGNYNFDLLANTARPFGEEKTSFSDLITIIPSTAPVTLLEVKKKDGKISLVFSREIDPVSIKANEFSVTLTDKNNASLSSTIASVTRDAVDTNILIITLNGRTVYDDDKAFVSYSGINSLVTSDGVFSATFSAREAAASGVNVLIGTNYDYSYETIGIASTNWRQNITFCGPCTAANSSYLYSTEQVHSGNKSLKLTVKNGGVAALLNTSDGTDVGDITFPVVAGGTYEVGAWTYLPSTNTFGTSSVEMRTFIISGATQVDPALEFATFNSSSPTNQWVYGKVNVVIPNGTGKLVFRTRNNIGGTTPVTVYMDDITVKKLNLRP